MNYFTPLSWHRPGLTEFLPISSSAHLVIVPLLGWNFPAEQIFPFDILAQLDFGGCHLILERPGQYRQGSPQRLIQRNHLLTRCPLGG
jgi:hypothetical protein